MEPSGPGPDAARRGARDVWDAIAPSYAAARQRPWPLVEGFLRGLPPGARVLDVGAGPGRHARAAAALGLRPLALDAALGFLAGVPAPLRGALVQADAAALPVRDASVDAVLLVAVLGTMPLREDRIAALREARRALRPGGALLVTVWARWQGRYLRALAGRGPWRRTGPGEVRAPWGAGAARAERAYYLYTPRGLAADLRAAGWSHARVRSARIAAGLLPDNLLVTARAGEVRRRSADDRK